MKFKILFFLNLVSILTVDAQLSLVENQTFEGSMSGWTISPSASWVADTNLYAGGHTSYRGLVPIGNNPGDTATITTPMYDFTGLAYVWLSFSHICKVSASDICQIEYKEDYTGSSWQPLPTSSYKGSGIYTNARFSHVSYSDWIPSDSLATPTNAWWKTEQFNVSDEVSLARAQFRFKITRGTALGTYFVYGWLIDNFQIHASANPIDPPYLEILSYLGDTVYSTGPFTLKAKVATRTYAPILTPKLYYSATFNGVTTNDSVYMTAIEGDSIWTAQIPQHVYGTSIVYSIRGIDSVGNSNTINGGFFIKRSSGGSTIGYTYYYPADTTGATSNNLAIIFHVNKINSWSRSLYLASEIGSSTQDITLTSLAWYNRTYNYVYLRPSVNVYMKCTTATSNTNLTHEIPSLSGATLVYSGPITTSLSWNEIKLLPAFNVPTGSNLMIYFEDSSGVIPGTSIIYWAGHLDNTRTVYQYDGSSISQSTMAPLMRFGLGVVVNDTHSVALIDILHPRKQVLAGQTTPIVTTIKNRGIAYLDSCIINYTINGVLQTPFYWKGNLPEDFNSSDTIGTYVPRLSQYDTIVVWVSMPNGVVDTTTTDDTLSIITYGCESFFQGDYVIGPNSGADFANVSSFLQALSLCGSAGNVTLHVQNGVYNENWDFSNLNDIMGMYTLRIKSQSGKRDSVILQPTGGVGIVLNNTNHLVIEDITINALTSNDYGVQFTGDANDVEFRNNVFLSDTLGNTAATSATPIYKASGTGIANDIRFIGNYISGGYYGIYLYAGTGSTARGINNVVDSNQFVNQAYSANYFYYTNFNSVSNNRCNDRLENAATTWHGLRFYYCNATQVNANTIRSNNLTTNYTTYGMYCYYMDSSLISNNSILINHDGTTAYGLYVYYTKLVEVINNSVVVDGINGTTHYGLYFYGASTAYDGIIQNNILVTTGASTCYPIYTASVTAIGNFNIDYNCYYGPTYVGYAGSALTTLADFQSAVSSDMHSVNINPSFIDVSNDLKLNTYTGLNCPRYPTVNHDFEDTPRSIFNYMGCYTAPLVSVNAALVSVLHVDFPANIGDTSQLEIVLLNGGIQPITSADINWSFNGVAQTSVHWTGNLSSQNTDTFSLGSVIYHGGYNDVVVWLSGIGSLVDTIPFDDTVKTSTYACYDSLSGEFILGKGPGADVSSMQEAFYIASLCGVNGDITLKLQHDTYKENWNFTNLSDIMGSHTLTITSLSENRDSVVLQPLGGVGIVLNNTQNLVIKNITINTYISNAYGVEFTGDASNVEFRNNVFLSDTMGATSAAPIYKASSTGLADDVRFIGNYISGGYYGMYFYAGTGSTARGINNVVDSNIFINQAYYATYFYYTNFTSVSNNKCSDRSVNGSNYWYGLRFYYCNASLVNANIIQSYNLKTGYKYGMYCYYMDSSLVSNNTIHLTHEGTTAYGLYVYYTKSIEVINNTVLVDGSVGSTHYGLYLYSGSTTYNGVLQNNILITTGASTCYPIYATSTTAIGNFNIDYNCYYGPVYVGYIAAAKATLAELQSSVPSDRNSVNRMPNFMRISLGFYLFDDIGMLCPVYSPVTTDIDNKIRDSITTIGAHHYERYYSDLMLMEFVSPKLIESTGLTTDIQVIIANLGLDTITSFQIVYELNGILVAPTLWNGVLLPGDTTLMQIGTFIPLSKFNSIKLYTFAPNGLSDEFPLNDTLQIEFFGCDSVLYGNYTVGATGDFASMDEAIKVLEHCGISASVVFEIQNGTYTEPLTMGRITGTTDSTTVTFISQSRNAADVIVNVEQTALTLDRASHVNFEYMTIYGGVIGVDMLGTCENVEFYRCTIATSNVETTNTYRAVNYANTSGSGNYLKDVRFIGNTISGGYYNMYLDYASSATSDMSKCLITIDSNTLVDAYCYGIYATYSKHTGISHNTITLRASSATQYGIYTNYTTLNDGMIGNKIQLNSSTTSYGIRLYNINAYAANGLAVVANNEVVHNGSGGTSYGMYCYYNNAYIYHNTVYLIGSNTSYPLYISTMSSSYQMIIKNNIFATYSSGTAYALGASGVNYVLQSYGTYLDYNNYYSSGSDLAYIGAALSSLSDLQTATGQDKNSISLNPNFISTTDLRLTSYSGFECPRFPEVQRDIQNYLRFSITNMGAYVRDPADIDVALSEFIGFSTAFASGSSHPVYAIVQNAGFNPLTSATISGQVNGINFTPVAYTPISPLLYGDMDTVLIGSFTFPKGTNSILATVSLPGDTIQDNDTIKDNRYMCISIMGGDYVIGPSATADYPTIDSLYSDVQRCGIIGDITMKFESGTYVDNWDFTNLSSIMGNHTLILTSLSGDRDSVTLKPASGVAILLNNTTNLVVRDMIIDNTRNNDYGVYFTGACENIEFRNIHFIGDKAGTSAAASPAPIYKGSGTGVVNDIRFIGNTIEGGYHGIYFYGGTGSGTYGVNVVVDSNEILDQYYYATYFYYTDFNSISNNKIFSRIQNAHTYWYGLYMYYCNFKANANKIHARTSFQYLYATYIYYSGYYNTSEPSVFSNNEIIGNTSSTYYGMYLGSYNVLNLYNNSIFMYGDGASRNIYVVSSTYTSLDIKNNIIVNANTSGTPLYFAGTTTPFTSNYNCLYSPSNIGYYSSAIYDLLTWQQTTGQDRSSISVYPSFIDTSLSLELNDYALFNCLKVPGVDRDINDSVRYNVTSMGCYTRELPEVDAALTEILHWDYSTLFVGDSSDLLQVILYNYGLTDITTASIQWTFNHVNQNTISWNGHLSVGECDTIDLGVVHYIGGYNELAVFIDALGTLSDTIPMNDTIRVTNYVCDSLLNGYYTIGSSGDFVDMDEAVVVLNTCGINGPVTFGIQPGTYLQNTTIGYISGTSPTNTITFTSTTGDRDDVVLQRADDAVNQVAPVMIKGGENIIIKHVTLSGMSPISSLYYYSHGIMITGNSKNIEVDSCYLFVPKNFSSAVTGTNQNAVHIKEATVYDVRITNNLIEGGSCGVYIYGSSSSSRINNILVKKNTIGFVDTYGLYIYYANDILVEDNVIIQRTGNLTPGNLYGVYNYYANTDILSNKIKAASFYYGIYTYYTNNESSTPALIANNEIMGDVISTSYRGIYLNSYTNANVYHNSMFLGGSIAGYGLYVTSSAYTYVNINNNNLIINTDGNGYPIYLASTSYIGTQWFINYNNYYNVNGTNIGYAGGDRTTMAAWQGAVSTDLNSVNVYPVFLDITSNMLVLDTSGITCPRLPVVADDILDSLRTPITTMGAYHFEPFKRDIMPMEFLLPSSTVSTGQSTPISIRIYNLGLDTITSFMVAYEVNGIAGIPYSWNGSLAPQDTTSVQIGNFMPLAKGNSLKVYTYLPNGSKDQFTLNDTLSTEVFACDSVMHGMYSIGATGDFATIYEAIQAVEHCGISASVVFEIENGTYTQGLAIGAIQGVNDSTTITFTSQSRNASDVIINVGHTALRLIDAAHLNFEYITIYGSVIGVEFVETCENIEFYRCTLATNTSSDHSSYRAVNYANTSGSGHYLKDVRFIGNTISGGYYNMYLYYASSSTSDMSKCLITIDSNTLVDAYCYGIYATYSKHTGISHNTITLRASSATQYGIYTNYTTLNDGMIGNKIQLNSSTTSYGIRLYYINAYAANGLAVVANNEVVHNGSGGTSYGMYCYYNNAYIYHNTVYLIGSNTSYPLYIGTMSSSYQMIIKNNIFATYSSGTAYALRASGVNYVLQSYGTYLDYNNYYSSGSDLAYIGAALSSLSDLQTATGQDQHSTNLNPNFINTNDLRLTSYDGFECPRMLQVHTDIRNYLRRPTTNMGAYVKDPSDIDVELLEFIGFSTAYASGASFPIQVVIRNAGFTPLSAATIRAKVNGVEITPIAYTSTIPLTYAEADTVSIGSFIFTPGINTILATATLTGDTLHENDTIKDSRFMCTIMMGGQYVIGASASADYPSFDSLMVDVLRCGINSNLSLKYESGTYAENWDLSNLSNIMGGYTLTISSLSGNRNSVIIRPSSGVAITLNNTHNLIVKDITIDNRGSIAYGVEFAGSATNIEFRNIYFMGDTLGTTAANAPAPIYKASSADLINDIRIIGNVIEGGYYGIYLYGGNSSSAYGTNVVIDSNIMRNQYYYANYFYYVDFNSISHNTMLSRRTSTNTSWYGIRSYYCNFVADGNKIHQRSTAITSPYLVYIYYAGYYNASQPSLFCNNELIGSSSTTYYAMYLGTYNVLNVYNNSIYMDGTGASRCIYIASSTSSSFDFKNNIIVNASSSGHVVYFAGTTTPCISDYNCLYSPGNIGYFSSSYTTLAAWQSATGTDVHSISVNPSFVDVSSSLELLDYIPFVVPMLTDITKDIQGNIRTSFTMMGAYSLALYEGYNLAITEIIGLKEVDDIHCFPDYETIQVVLSNNGTQDYDFSVNSIHVRLEINGAIHYQKDTLINGGSLLALRKDTIELGNMIPVSTLGAYYITVYVSSNVDTLYVDDTLRTNYNVHKIAMPYDEDFSTRPPEFVFKQILGAVNWEVQSGTGSNPTIAPVFGTGRLHFASESGAGSIAQAILNGIDLRGSNQPTLEFWFAHDNTSYNNDLMEIKVSTDGGATTQTLRTVYRYHAWYPTPGWEHIVIDLSAYTQESCLSLIFEASSFGGGNQNIDRIRIASKPDVAISLIAPKEEDLVACKTSNQRLKVVVSNMTTQYVDFDQDTTQIVLNVSGADVVAYTYPLSGQLAGLSSDTLEITQTFDMSNNGTYDLIAYIEAIDSNFVNDTSKATIQINNDLSIDKVVGVDAVNCKKIGDSVYVSFTVYNLGNLVVDEIPLSLQINGVNVIVDTVYTSLMPGDSLLYDFTEAYVVPVVTYIQPYYFVKVQTQLACDAANANNIREIMACVDLPEIVDLQIQTVNKPLETVCDTGLRTVYVSVTLANEGTSDISSAVLHVEIDSAGTPWASFSETTDAIPSEGTTTHIFSQGYIVPNFTSNYIVRVYVDSLPADENLTNDSLEILACAILDDVSIDAFGQVSWTMEQNIPNPARTNTRIPYAIPQEGAILFKVMSINGQVLYTKEIDAMAGSHSMEFDITTLSNGIYYYSMEYQGQRIVKKMTIQK